MRRSDATAQPLIVAFGAVGRAQIDGLTAAGATRVLMRAQEPELPRVARELLGLE